LGAHEEVIEQAADIHAAFQALQTQPEEIEFDQKRRERCTAGTTLTVHAFAQTWNAVPPQCEGGGTPVRSTVTGTTP
jgi:hypothetical protein